MSSVLVVGDALMDKQFFIDTMPKAGQDEQISGFRKSTGGSAANTATMLAVCGVKTYFCGSVGDDEDGQIFLSHFEKNNVDTSLVRQSGSTGFTVTMIERSGERTMFSYRDASAAAMEVSDKLKQRISEIDLVLLSGYLLQEKSQAAFALKIAELAKADSGKAALDPSPVIGSVDKKVLMQLLELTDVLLPNEDELAAIMQMVGEVSVPCVAVKLGSQGARMVYDIAEYSQPAIKTDAIDTTGAGDAFNAGFLASMISGEPPQTWLKKGVELAATVVGRKGAV